nr:MAG TPA: hypothetical protein [Caudoviricetes sp.]
MRISGGAISGTAVYHSRNVGYTDVTQKIYYVGSPNGRKLKSGGF